MKNKIVITGAGGLIGSVIAGHFASSDVFSLKGRTLFRNILWET